MSPLTQGLRYRAACDTSQVIADFVLKFVAMTTGVILGVVDRNDAIRCSETLQLHSVVSGTVTIRWGFEQLWKIC